MKQTIFYKEQIGIRTAHNAVPLFIMVLFTLGFFLNSCQKEFEIVVGDGEPISLSTTDTTVVLEQKFSTGTAVNFQWTRGTNLGTGSPISYTLQLDLPGNAFASAITYDLGKGIYEKSFTGKELNALMVDTLGQEAGAEASLEVHVTADIYDPDVPEDISETITISVTTYEPVSEVLYILGSATGIGDDIANAIQLSPTPDKEWEFTYEDLLYQGSFLISESRDDCWCQDFYTMDPADEEMMILNEGSVGDDNRWVIPETGYYKLKVNLIDQTISIEKALLSPYTDLYIVGDASPSGWDIATPQSFTQSLEDPNIFIYEGHFTPGEFKISTFTGDWCDGDWLHPSQESQPITATDFVIESGCSDPDKKWILTEGEEGRYKVIVDFTDNTVAFEPVKVYLIGDGGPNGWDIATPDSMVYADGVYTFTGELGASNPTGEFKFSKFTGNWCDGEWILAASKDQPLSNTSYTTFNGCPPDDQDFKWRLAEGDAGNYVITIDLDAGEISITKQ